VNASISPRTSPRKGKGKGKAIEKTNKDISPAPQSPVLLSQHQQYSPRATRDTPGNPFDELAVEEEHQIQDGGVTGSPLDDVLPLDEGRDLRDRWRINWIEEVCGDVSYAVAPLVLPNAAIRHQSSIVSFSPTVHRLSGRKHHN
jgi:hypothetical protein